MKNDVQKRSVRVAVVLAALLALFAPPPAALAQAPYPKQLSLGQFHSCVLMSDGGVRCWGDFNLREVINIPGPAPITQISASFESTCVLKSDGDADCYGWWGSYNDADSAGNAGPFTQIADSEDSACGLKPNGDVLCWSTWGPTSLYGLYPGPFTQIDAYVDACGIVPAADSTRLRLTGCTVGGAVIMGIFSAASRRSR